MINQPTRNQDGKYAVRGMFSDNHDYDDDSS